METLYAGFIKHYIEAQPKDQIYSYYFDLHEQTASLGEKDNTNTIRRFFAIHAFILGIKLGLALAEDLKGPA